VRVGVRLPGPLTSVTFGDGGANSGEGPWAKFFGALFVIGGVIWLFQEHPVLSTLGALLLLWIAVAAYRSYRAKTSEPRIDLSEDGFEWEGEAHLCVGQQVFGVDSCRFEQRPGPGALDPPDLVLVNVATRGVSKLEWMGLKGEWRRISGKVHEVDCAVRLVGGQHYEGRLTIVNTIG
jgi:hypothetical protein